MDKKESKRLKNFVKEHLKNEPITSTQEQIQYILEAYQEEGYVVGLHKSQITHEKILQEGLYNQTSMYQNSNDISNTVATASMPDRLCTYANLGEDRKSTIIVKIPYKAFIGEENLYKINEQGRYIIPPEFILGALEENGAIYENEKYRGTCPDATIPNEADFTESTMRAYNKLLAQRQEECELFLQAKREVEHPIKSRIEKFIALFQRKSKTLALPEKTQVEPRKTICEKVGEPNLGDRTKYLSQSNEQSIEKEEGR